jgi:ABC-type transport system substrate-binding protein
MSVWLDAYLTRSYDMIANSYSMVGTDPATYCSVLLAALKDYQTADLGELNTLVESGATTSDAEAREEIYQSIQEILVNYRPVTSYVECPSLNGAAEDLNGIVVNGMGHTILKYAKFGD